MKILPICIIYLIMVSMVFARRIYARNRKVGGINFGGRSSSAMRRVSRTLFIRLNEEIENIQTYCRNEEFNRSNNEYYINRIYNLFEELKASDILRDSIITQLKRAFSYKRVEDRENVLYTFLALKKYLSVVTNGAGVVAKSIPIEGSK